MIALIRGKLVAKDLDSLEVMTSGGVGYELTIPLGVYETLPRVGEDLSLHTSLVVKEDSWQLFGFVSVFEKRLFEKLLTANGVGPVAGDRDAVGAVGIAVDSGHQGEGHPDTSERSACR